MEHPQIINVTEEIVKGLVSFLLRGAEYQTFCHCAQCEVDTVAIALNALPPKYVASSSSRDAAFASLSTPEHMEQINREIIRALHIVSSNPRHNQQAIL